MFADQPRFRPNRSPKEILQAGAFGGTYFRTITSGVTGEVCFVCPSGVRDDINVDLISCRQTYRDAWRELPADWIVGLDVRTQVASATYREGVNKYGVKCGQSKEAWEASGWIIAQDPFGWFQWYCRFFQGRRSSDDDRQISRWFGIAGPKGRWKTDLVKKVLLARAAFDDASVSPVVRQTLLHWGFELTEAEFARVSKRLQSS